MLIHANTASNLPYLLILRMTDIAINFVPSSNGVKHTQPHFIFLPPELQHCLLWFNFLHTKNAAVSTTRFIARCKYVHGGRLARAVPREKCKRVSTSVMDHQMISFYRPRKTYTPCNNIPSETQRPCDGGYSLRAMACISSKSGFISGFR